MQSQVLITDPLGNIDCAGTDAKLNGEEVRWTYLANTVKMNVYVADKDGYIAVPFAISPDNFPLDKDSRLPEEHSMLYGYY